jgi:hypothetical protein
VADGTQGTRPLRCLASAARKPGESVPREPGSAIGITGPEPEEHVMSSIIAIDSAPAAARRRRGIRTAAVIAALVATAAVGATAAPAEAAPAQLPVQVSLWTPLVRTVDTVASTPAAVVVATVHDALAALPGSERVNIGQIDRNVPIAMG